MAESEQKPSEELKEVPKTETDFLQEKIKERPINRKKLVRHTMATAGLAVVFGIVACVTFLIVSPIISNRINPQETVHTVTFPEETEELDPQDMAVDEEQLHISQMETEAAQAESMPPQTQPEMPEPESEELTETEAQELALQGVKEQYAALGSLADELTSSLVTVMTMSEDTSWIIGTLQDLNEMSGLILGDNGRELLILVTDYQTLADADSIYVTFASGESAEATMKKYDTTTKLAVLSVAHSAVTTDLLEAVTPAVLGSSLGTRSVGAPVIAIGAPTGSSGSLVYGMVTAQSLSLDMVDADYKLLTTDISENDAASGVIVNLQGQILGIIYHPEKESGVLSAIGISELKKSIEKLSNGGDLAYMGIHGSEISNVVRQQYQIPTGAYIASIEMSSPAMRAGIQSGDIITEFNGNVITSYSELIKQLVAVNSGDEVEVTLVRQGQGDTYQEMTVTVELSAQP
ncbi:MAG: S1C family serine protease [Lachnospiraceae bacterium]|nr:S1C family serine protease [Lachnospiraceae bacterium]